jgi:hypothetical protein
MIPGVTMTTTAGRGSGWSVAPNVLAGGWQWSAFGARGGQTGLAPDRKTAEQRAQATERYLKLPGGGA